MKTNVQENSLLTWHSDAMKSQDLKAQIEAYSLTVNHFTNTMVSNAIGRVQSTLTSKINQLLADGTLVKELSKAKCPCTGNQATWSYNPKFTNQLRLM
jgi:Rps23 Pro-64 3,4-dihydroxylase Tpa1-like proline 4-hydroxylase